MLAQWLLDAVSPILVPAFVDRAAYSAALAPGRASVQPRLAPTRLMEVLLYSATLHYTLMLTCISRARCRIFATNDDHGLARAVQDNRSLTPELRSRIQDASASLGPNSRTTFEAGPLSCTVVRGAIFCPTAPKEAAL